MGRLDELKAAMNGSNNKMGHDLGSVDTSVLGNQAQESSARQSVAQTDSTVAAPEKQAPADTGVNSLYEFYIRMTSTFGRIHEEVLQQNQLVIVQGLPADVRKVSLESLMFVAEHFGDLMAALILDYKDMRHIFADALGQELDLLKISADQRKIEHEKNGGYGFDDNDHSIELGISRFTPSMELQIVGVMHKSMSVINNTKLSAAIDSAFNNDYEQSDADDIGALLSNPVFLLVLFNNNASFVAQIAHICADLKSEYEIA